MHNLIDRLIATKHDRTTAEFWAEYAINNYGPDGVKLLKSGFHEPMKPKSRRTLRLAIDIAECRLHQRIWITTMPSAMPMVIAGPNR